MQQGTASDLAKAFKLEFGKEGTVVDENTVKVTVNSLSNRNIRTLSRYFELMKYRSEIKRSGTGVTVITKLK